MAPPASGMTALHSVQAPRSSFLGIVLQQQCFVPVSRPGTCPPLPILATLAPAALQRWELAARSGVLWSADKLEKCKRSSSVVCRGLKMDDKYPRRQLTPEEEEQERNKKARRLRKRVRSDLQGPEGAWRQDWWRPKSAQNDREEDDSNPAVLSERRMRRDKKLPVTNLKALGGGTYGGQFTKNGRKRKLAVDTADFARLVTERAESMPAAAVLDLQALPGAGSVQQSPARDAKDVKTRMSWYLESIGVDLDKVDVNQVPGVAEDQEMKVEYMQRLGLQEEQVARIIEGWPQLLRCSLSRNIKPVVEYLQSDWVGLRGEQLLSFLSSYPQVLYMSVEMGIKPVLEWMRGVGLHRGEVRDVLLRFPQILEGRIDGTMSGCVAFLVSVGVPLEAIKSVVYGCPEILLCSIRQILKPRIELLVRELAMTEEEVVSLLLDKPQLLKCDLVEAYQNLITFLEQEGLSPYVNPRLIFKHSSLGTVTEARTCFHKELALLKGLNMGVADIGKVLSCNPSILVHDVAALEGRIDCLLRAGFTSQQVVGMIKRCPKLLNCSQEVLEAKTAHLLSELRCLLDEAVDFPDYFLCDLGHIRQRHMQLQETGMLEFSLQQLCTPGRDMPKRGTFLTGSTSYGSYPSEALAPQNGASDDRRHESRTKDRRKLVAKPISLPINYHIDVKLERLKLAPKVKLNVKQR